MLRGSIIYGMPQSGAKHEPQPSHKSGRSPSPEGSIRYRGLGSRQSYVFNFTLTSALAR
jgi:hypothetical protein